MSYLSQLKNGQISASLFLAKSIGYLKGRLGVTVTDEAVDNAVKATDEFTDQLEAIIAAYIAKNAPALPGAVAVAASTMILNMIDASIASAANVIKENN